MDSIAYTRNDNLVGLYAICRVRLKCPTV